MAEVRARAPREVPEARIELIQVLQDVLDDLSGNPRPIEVKIFGPDQATLERLARLAAARIEDTPGLEDFFDGVEGSVPVLRAEIDPTRAARVGVSPADVQGDLEVALAGRVASQVRLGDRAVGVRVHAPDAVRFDPEAIAGFPLAYGGTTVPLRAVARLSRPVSPAATWPPSPAT
jgi:Cu/Ag efflux pump CusA